MFGITGKKFFQFRGIWICTWICSWVCVGGGGCEKSKAVSSDYLTVEEYLGKEVADVSPSGESEDVHAGIKPELTGEERAKVLAIMQSAAREHVPPPFVAQGMRWTDVPEALELACDKKGVEMGIVSTEADDQHYDFQLVTIEDWPVHLVIERLEDERVYEVRTVEVGRFNNRPERGDALIDALAESMQEIAERPRFPEELEPSDG